jgi:3-oxoadipate enol-lactonase
VTTVMVNRMVVEVAGAGPAVVMVHGLGGTSNTFQPQMEALRDYRVIRVDLPGAGQSAPAHGAPSIECLADAVVGATAALGVARAHFVGHSMGTIICQHIAAQRPDLVASLSLFGALIEPSDAMRTGLAGRARLARHEGMTPIADQIIEAALSAETKTSRPAVVAFVRESIMRQNPEGYAGHCEALAKAQAVDHRLIGAPALLVAGDADATAPASTARILAERLKGASVAVIERSGHWLTIEKPVECNDKLRDFLQRVPVD